MKEEKGFNTLIARLEQESDQIDDTVRLLIRRLWQWGVERIFDDDLRKSLSNYFQARVPYQFFTSPASSSGRYHVRWHNEPGGIVLHIIESCILVDVFLNSYGFMDRDKQIREDSRWMRDVVLAATLISDTQKCGMPWNGETLRNHGEVAAERWKMVAIGCNVPGDTIIKVLEATAYHYGRFTQEPSPRLWYIPAIVGQSQENISYLEGVFELWELPIHVQITHLADSISSNRILENIYNPRRRIPPPPPEDKG